MDNSPQVSPRPIMSQKKDLFFNHVTRSELKGWCKKWGQVKYMRHSGIYKKKKCSLFSLLLLFIGISGMIFVVTFDFFKASVPNFGINQLAGFVVSAIIALAGLRRIALLRARIWDGLLLLIYLAGIVFMGLRFNNHGLNRSSGMLHDLSFSFSDVAINILGFAG
ncbi:MAG: hypothetical protein DRH24_15435 [Deltaproteobacteria bacterium]|nr:MAG: hypothetical protein DRH24_15435 [Deltaproteobacteria bacterium]